MTSVMTPRGTGEASSPPPLVTLEELLEAVGRAPDLLLLDALALQLPALRTARFPDPVAHPAVVTGPAAIVGATGLTPFAYDQLSSARGTVHGATWREGPGPAERGMDTGAPLAAVAVDELEALAAAPPLAAQCGAAEALCQLPPGPSPVVPDVPVPPPVVPAPEPVQVPMRHRSPPLVPAMRVSDTTSARRGAADAPPLAALSQALSRPLPTLLREPRLQYTVGLPSAVLAVVPAGYPETVAASAQGVVLLSPHSSRRVGRPRAHALTGVLRVVMAPNGLHLAVGCADGILQVVECAAMKVVRAYQHHKAVRDVCFSSNGFFVLSACADGGCRLWPIAGGTLTPASSYFGHRTSVGCVAMYQAPSDLALSAADDGQVHLWHAASGAPVRVVVAHRYPVLAAMFIGPVGGMAGPLLAVSADRRAIAVVEILSPAAEVCESRLVARIDIAGLLLAERTPADQLVPVRESPARTSATPVTITAISPAPAPMRLAAGQALVVARSDRRLSIVQLHTSPTRAPGDALPLRGELWGTTTRAPIIAAGCGPTSVAFGDVLGNVFSLHVDP